MSYPARSILAIDISPFGRSLALLPAIRALRASYRQTFLAAAAPNGTCELLRASGLVDETIDLGVIKFSQGRAGALKRLMVLAGRSRRYTVDLVLDFSPRLETQFVSHLILRARTLTPSRLPRSIEMMLNLGGIPRRTSDTASDYVNVLQQAGVEMNDIRFGVILPGEEDARFEKLLARGGFQGGEPIVSLFAADPNGRDGWPVETFGEIGMRLANNFGARLVAADEPSDRTFTDAVASLLPPRHQACGAACD